MAFEAETILFCSILANRDIFDIDSKFCLYLSYPLCIQRGFNGLYFQEL